MIVIPAIDIRGGKVVRLTRGRPEEETVYANDPVEVAERFAAGGAEWLHVVDIDAAFGSGDNREAVRRVTESVQVPVQVGGGLRSLEAVESALSGGAARAIVGTRALEDEEFTREAVTLFAQRLVVSVDVEGEEVRVRGWTAGTGGLDTALKRLDGAGVARVLVTAVGRDGLLGGPDLELYERVGARTNAHIIASGGVRSAGDVRALAAKGVEAAIVGKALYEGSLTVSEAKKAAA